MKVTQVYEGHFDEITKLAVVGTTIISASLDGTIRTWDTRKAPEKLVLKKEEPKKDADPATPADPKKDAPKPGG